MNADTHKSTTAAHATNAATAAIRIPKERQHFNTLLLANPNYFGNLKQSPYKPVKLIGGNTTYEELKCVGYNPDLNTLKAVVQLKQSGGYSGSLCTAGSQEYVRFFLSFDNGSTWQDQGYASFTAHDLPGTKPLDYAVTVKPQAGSTFCWTEKLPRVRAVLSWNAVPPPDPDYMPVWGNVVDAHIQVQPRKLIALGDLVAQSQIELPKAIGEMLDLASPVPASAAAPLTPVEILKLYQGQGVQTHRALYPALHAAASNPALIAAQAEFGSKGTLTELGIDLAPVIAALLDTQGDTSFERLDCVGFDPNGTPTLSATFTIRRSSGYLGSQCQSGSPEYVAFFVDWLDGSDYQWAGTTQITVHDFASIPADGLRYTVAVPIDVSAHVKPCDQGPVLARLRAVLSWNAAPPPDPDYVPVWGNHVDGEIQISSGSGTALGDYTPYLEGVCGVSACSIDGNGFAPGARPFGGGVSIFGFIPGAPKVNMPEALRPRYRLQVRQLSPLGPWQTLNDSIGVTIEQQIGGAMPTASPATLSVDANGYYTYENATPDAALGWREVFPSHLLTVWNTAGKSGKWEIKLDALDPATHVAFPCGAMLCTATGTTTGNVVIDLDNAAPLTGLQITGYSRNGGPVRPAVNCASFQVGDVIYGSYSVADEHFGSLTLRVEPSVPANGAVVQLSVDGFATLANSSRAYPTVANAGESGQWRLDTAGMDPCGYTVQLLSNDRSIVGCNGPWENNNEFVGFCLVAPA
jgi:hypothetical protein